MYLWEESEEAKAELAIVRKRLGSKPAEIKAKNKLKIS